jgi:hypothetical protein
MELGILAVLFNDGSIRVFVVPHSQLLRNKYSNIPEDATMYGKAP